MEWTKEKPSVAGYYWTRWREDAKPHLVEVYDNTPYGISGWWVDQLEGYPPARLDDFYNGEWLGPVTVEHTLAFTPNR